MPAKRPIRRIFSLSEEENDTLFEEAAKTGETISSTIRGLIKDGLHYRTLMTKLEEKIA